MAALSCGVSICFLLSFCVGGDRGLVLLGGVVGFDYLLLFCYILSLID